MSHSRGNGTAKTLVVRGFVSEMSRRCLVDVSLGFADPFAANIGLFLDWALWFREGRLSFQQCPHCHLVYVQQETVCPDDHDFMNAAPVAKKHGSPVDQNYDTVPDCPYCRLKLEISKKRPSSRNKSGTS